MSSLGIGVAGILSVGARMQLAVESDCLAQSLARRLITPRGSLPWSPNDGTDMRDFLNHGNTPLNRFSAERAAKDEIEKDERVESADVSAVFSGNGVLTLTVQVSTADGTFDLVLAISALTVSILDDNS